MRNKVFTAEAAVKRILEREEQATAKAKTEVTKHSTKIKKKHQNGQILTMKIKQAKRNLLNLKK